MIVEDLTALMQKQEEFYLHLDAVSLEDIENNLELLKTPISQDKKSFDTFVKEQATITKISTLSNNALDSVQYQIKKSSALGVLQQVNQQQTQLARYLELKEMLTQIIDHSVLKPESIVKLTLTDINLVWILDFNQILKIVDFLKHRQHWQVTGKVLPNVELLCKYGIDKLYSYFDLHVGFIKEHSNTNITIRHQKLKVCAPVIKMLKKTYPDIYSKIRLEYYTVVEQYYSKLFTDYIATLKNSSLPEHDKLPYTDWLKPHNNTHSIYFVDQIGELLKPEKHVVFISPTQKFTQIKIAQALLKVLVDTWSSERQFLVEFFALQSLSISKKEPRHPDYDTFKSTHSIVFSTLHQLISKFELTNLMIILQTIFYLGNATPIAKQELRLSNLLIETTSILRQHLKDLINYLTTHSEQNKHIKNNEAEYNLLQCPPSSILHGSQCMLDLIVMSIHINNQGIIFSEFWDMLYTTYKSYVLCLHSHSRVNSITILHYHVFIIQNMYLIDSGIRLILNQFELPQKEIHYKLFDSCVDQFCKDMMRWAFPGLASVLEEYTIDIVEMPSQDLLEQTSEEFNNLWRNMLQEVMLVIPICFEEQELSRYLQKKYSEYFIVTWSSYLNLMDKVLLSDSKNSGGSKRYPFKRQPQPMQSLLSELKKYNI